MDNVCSKHMIGRADNFISHKTLQGRGISFGNRKTGYILGVGRVGKLLDHLIENVHYISGLTYILLSVSQICYNDNEVKF